MMAKPIKALELYYPMIHFLINVDRQAGCLELSHNLICYFLREERDDNLQW